jgi:hypothetical protein
MEAFLWRVSKRLCKAKPADDSIQGLEQCGNLRPASLVSANPTTDLEKYLVEPLTCFSRPSKLGKTQCCRQDFNGPPHYVEVLVSFIDT